MIKQAKERLKQAKNLKELQEIAKKDSMLFRLIVKSLHLKDLLDILDNLNLPYPESEVIEFLAKELTKRLQEHLTYLILS